MPCKNQHIVLNGLCSCQQVQLDQEARMVYLDFQAEGDLKEQMVYQEIQALRVPKEQREMQEILAATEIVDHL